MVGCHHRLNGHEFQQTPGDGEGQGGLACFSPGVSKLDTTEQPKKGPTVAGPGLCINWGMEKNALKTGF